MDFGAFFTQLAGWLTNPLNRVETTQPSYEQTLRLLEYAGDVYVRRRKVGAVPVLGDGSAHFQIPGGMPIVLHLVAPTATTRYLTAFNGWLRAHGKVVLICVLVAVGGIMVINGIYGLAVVR